MCKHVCKQKEIAKKTDKESIVDSTLFACSEAHLGHLLLICLYDGLTGKPDSRLKNINEMLTYEVKDKHEMAKIGNEQLFISVSLCAFDVHIEPLNFIFLGSSICN